LICLKGSQIGRIKPLSMNWQRQWDWLDIAGYVTLALTALALLMIFAF
jgi:hypothetical protein